MSTKKVALTLEDHSTPFKIVVGIKVRGDSESAGAELSVEYHNFPVAQQGAKIFEFKVDPVPKLTFLNVMSGIYSTLSLTLVCYSNP